MRVTFSWLLCFHHCATAIARDAQRHRGELNVKPRWTHDLPPTQGSAILGYPPMTGHVGDIPSLSLAAPIAVHVTGRCTGFNRTDLSGKTLVVFGSELCAGQTSGLLLLLARKVTGTIAAIISKSGRENEESEPNFALVEAARTPRVLINRPGSFICSVLPQWAENLGRLLLSAPSHPIIEVSVAWEQITELGVAYDGIVAAEHMTYYVFEHPVPEAITITVTPIYGNPDLYVNLADRVGNADLPNPMRRASATQTSPGDDVLTVRMTLETPAMIIGVYGMSASAFSLSISTNSTLIQLESGLPRRVEVGSAGESRYFSITAAAVPAGSPKILLAVTTLSATLPDLFVSGTLLHPNQSSAQWTALASSHPAYQHVEIPAGSTCYTVPCTYYATVQAYAPTVFSILAVAGASKVRLIDGVPQAGQIMPTAAGSTSFMVRVAGSHTNLHLGLSMVYGTAHMYVSNDLREWSSESLSTGDEHLTIRSTDAGFCVFCNYTVRVSGPSRAVFSITSSSDATMRTLQDGSPVTEQVSSRSCVHYKFVVVASIVDVEVVLSAFSGDPDLYLSTTTARPTSTTPGVYSSDGHTSAGEVIKIQHSDPKLARCTQDPDPCILYASVCSSRTDSTFSLVASALDVSDGFHVDEPAAVSGAYPFAAALFGPRLPQRMLTRCIRDADPPDACGPLSTNMSGFIALLDRGSAVSGIGACGYPDLYFANKIMRAQEAGAEGVVVANNVATGGDAGLVNMVGNGADLSQHVAVPSVFVTKAVGDLLREQLAKATVTCVKVSLSAPTGRAVTLVDGVPQQGALPADGYQMYELWTPPGRDTLTLSLSAHFGNPDLFVSSHGEYPNQHTYTWSSREAGSDTIVINANDPDACTLCIYNIGVLAIDGATRFTLMAQVNQTLRTLQASVPLAGQEVRAEGYVHYRFFVDRRSSGMTFILTTTTGAAVIFASFSNERPTKESHDFTSQCDGDVVACGPSLAHGAALHVAPNDPAFCRRTPCLLYVAVHGLSEATYSLLAYIEEDEEHTVALSDGNVQRMALPHAGSYARFSFYAASPVLRLTIDVTAIRGDPDLFVNTRPGRAWPTREHHDVTSSTAAHETLSIVPGRDGACTECTYQLSVYAYDANTEFFISITTQDGTLLLTDGVPVLGNVEASGSVQYYRYFVRESSALHVVLTPTFGHPSLHARFGCPPLSHDPCSDRTPPTRISDGNAGVEQLTLLASDSSFCEPPCTLYIGVQGETDSSYSIVVSQGSQDTAGQSVTLLGGQPQAGVVDAQGLAYFRLTTNLTFGLSVTLTAFAGAPKLVYSVGPDPPLPTPASHTGSIHSAAEPLHISGRNEEGSFIFGVYGGGSPANFSLLALPGSSIGVLMEDTPQIGQVQTGKAALFMVQVPSRAVMPQLHVTSLAGSLRVLIDKHGRIPSEWAHTLAAVATPEQPVVLPLFQGSRNVIAISHHSSMHESTSFGTFSLLAALMPDSRVLLLDGWPQALELSGEQPSYLRLVFAPGLRVIINAIATMPLAAPVSLSASLTNPRPEVCAGQSCYTATGLAGAQSVQLTIPRSDDCYSQCSLHIALTSSAEVAFTITASTQGYAFQLPLGVPGCTSVAPGQLAQYAVMLNPDDDADDRVSLRLYVCSGTPELWAQLSSPPSAERLVHDYTSSSPLWDPILLPKRSLSGRSRVFAAVHGKGATDASVCLVASPADEPPPEQVLYEPDGLVEWGGKDELTFHPPPNIQNDEQTSMWYQVWASRADADAALTSWCGISQRNAQLLANVSAVELVATMGAKLRLTLRPAEHGVLAEHALVVSLVAIVLDARSHPQQRIIYQPLEWRPHGKGAGFTVAILVIVFIVVTALISFMRYHTQIKRVVTKVCRQLSRLSRQQESLHESMSIPLTVASCTQPAQLSESVTLPSTVERASQPQETIASTIIQQGAAAPAEAATRQATTSDPTQRYQERMARARANAVERTSMTPSRTGNANETASEVLGADGGSYIAEEPELLCSND